MISTGKLNFKKNNTGQITGIAINTTVTIQTDWSYSKGKTQLCGDSRICQGVCQWSSNNAYTKIFQQLHFYIKNGIISSQYGDKPFNFNSYDVKLSQVFHVKHKLHQHCKKYAIVLDSDKLSDNTLMSAMTDWCFVVVANISTPSVSTITTEYYKQHGSNFWKLIYLSIDDQVKLYPYLSTITEWNHYTRRLSCQT